MQPVYTQAMEISIKPSEPGESSLCYLCQGLGKSTSLSVWTQFELPYISKSFEVRRHLWKYIGVLSDVPHCITNQSTKDLNHDMFVDVTQFC